MCYAVVMRDQDISVRYWLVTSRPFFRRAGFTLLIFLDVLIAAFLLISWIRYTRSVADYETISAALATNVVNYQEVNQRLAPPTLTVKTAALLKDEAGTYDFVAVVQNPSARWAVESVSYHFLVNDEVMVSGAAFLFPEEEKLITDFNHDFPNVPSRASVTLELDDYQYRRVNTDRDLEPFRVSVVDPRYRVLSSGPRNQQSQVTGTLKHEGVVDYPEIIVTAVLLNGESVVAAGQILLEQVVALQERSIDIRFPQVLPVTKVLLQPSLVTFPVRSQDPSP